MRKHIRIINIIEGHHKHALAQQSANATRYWYERAVNSGMARLTDLANLPMVAPAVALNFGRRKGASRYTSWRRGDCKHARQR